MDTNENTENTEDIENADVEGHKVAPRRTDGTDDDDV